MVPLLRDCSAREVQRSGPAQQMSSTKTGRRTGTVEARHNRGPYTKSGKGLTWVSGLDKCVRTRGKACRNVRVGAFKLAVARGKRLKALGDYVVDWHTWGALDKWASGHLRDSGLWVGVWLGVLFNWLGDVVVWVCIWMDRKWRVWTRRWVRMGSNGLIKKLIYMHIFNCYNFRCLVYILFGSVF